MSMLPTKQPTSYPDGMTKQSFKDETDINKLLQRAQKTGTISHLNKHEARYGDFSDFDFFEATLKLTQGREIFDELPSEVRAEFRNSPADFFKYVNDPANRDRLDKLMPALAAPGRQNIDVSGKVSPDTASEPVASATTTTQPVAGGTVVNSTEPPVEAPIPPE